MSETGEITGVRIANTANGTPSSTACSTPSCPTQGIEVVLTGVRLPRMNAIMERWVQTCRRELLDRALIWNQGHLVHALHEFEWHYNEHRPHQGIANTRPLHPLPVPITEPDTIARLDVRRCDRFGGILHEYRHAS